MASSKISGYAAPLTVTVAMFLMGAGMRGEWILILAHVKRYLQGSNPQKEGDDDENNPYSLAYYKLQNWPHFVMYSFAFSYIIYFGMGGFLHWYYYQRQKHHASEWKCQPTKWHTPEIQRQEIMLGTMSLTLATALSGFVACYTYNGGKTTVYYEFNQYGWLWFFLQAPAIYFYQDYVVYWHHRMHHLPWFYKRFHKLHHQFKQPTPFSATAVHPLEFIELQAVYISPIVLFPVHWVPFICVLSFIFYNGIIEHSGINFKRSWWQVWKSDAIFHDNHHQYFHVNFGLNCDWWDKIHGTQRRIDRIYREDVFYGKGKPLDEASLDEIQADITERKAENPTAYRSNRNEFDLDIKEYKKKCDIKWVPVDSTHST